MWCPDCGGSLKFIKKVNDRGTYHDEYECSHGCGKKWWFTYTESDELLHIAPMDGDDE